MNFLDSTFDLSALACLTPADVEAYLSGASPTAPYGAVIVGNSAPDAVTTPALGRFLWIRTTGGAYTGEIYLYNGTSWEPIIPQDGSKILTGTIPLNRLSVNGLTPLHIPRVNAGGTSFEAVAPSDAIPTNTLTISKLNSPATGRYIIVSENGSKSWVILDSAYILDLLADGDIPLVKLALTGTNTVLGRNAAGVPGMYAVMALVPDGAIELGKLATSSANRGKWLRYNPTTGAPEAADLPTSGGTGGSVNFASQAEVTAGTESSKAIAPDKAKYIPGLVRCWAIIEGTFGMGSPGFGTATILDSYNVASSAIDGSGKLKINFTTAMGSANYPVLLFCDDELVDINQTITYNTAWVEIHATFAGSAAKKISLLIP